MTSEPDKGEITKVFDAIRDGAKDAQDRLFSLVYEELRRIAHGRMSRERPGQTLQTTALVNEAYLRLCKDDGAHWENRRHFFGAAANAMRRILIDKARERAAEKREGERRRVTLDAGMASEDPPLDLLALNEALENLSTTHVRAAEVVKFRYFIGLTVKETAELLEVSPRTVDADWKLARAWLLREMTGAA